MRKLLLAVLGVLLLVSAAQAAEQLGTAHIDVMPTAPTAGEPVTLLLSGTWPNSCVPQSRQVLRLGSLVFINTSHPGEECLPASTDWQMEVSMGELSAGTYTVTVSFEGDTIGQGAFTVGEEPAAPPDYWDPPTEPAACENPYLPPLALLLSTLDEVPWGASLPMSLVVTTTAYDHAFLFTSGQRYDFAVFTEAGEEVWGWSNDQAFLMAMGEETYTMDGVLYFERLDTGQLPGPGTYTLRGTLTVEGRIEGDGVVEQGSAHVCTTFEVIEG